MRTHLLLLGLLAISAAPATAVAQDDEAPPRDLAGTYVVDGTNPGGKTRYAGEVKLSARRDGPSDASARTSAYDVAWTVGASTYTGQALQLGAKVVVGWGDGCQVGFFEISYEGTGFELLGRAETPGDTYPPPFDFAPTIKKTGKDGWSGSYKIDRGTLKVKKGKPAWRYDLSWKSGKTKGTALGAVLAPDTALAIVAGKACGIIVYDVTDAGLSGRWTMAGKKTEGLEVLTKK